MVIACGTSLLPQSPDMQMTDPSTSLRVLKLMRFIVEQGVCALSQFIKKEYSQFDAQVGETLCQIRAYQIYLLSDNDFCRNIESLENERSDLIFFYESISEKIYECETSRDVKKFNRKQILRDFLESHKLVLDISYNVFFLIISYILSKYSIKDTEGIPVAIDYDRFIYDANISKYLAKKTMHYFQKKISDISCDFIFKILNQSSGLDEQKKVLFLMRNIADEGRSVLPCYEVTHIIINHLVEKEGFVLIVVNRDFFKTKDKVIFLLKGCKKDRCLKIIDEVNSECLKSASMVFEGVSTNSLMPRDPIDFIGEFEKYDFRKIILSNTASHPQFSGKKLYEVHSDPYKFLIKSSQVSEKCIADTEFNNIKKACLTKMQDQYMKMKSFAENYGCEQKNPKLFYVKHIFCDTVEKQLAVIEESNSVYFANNLVQINKKIDLCNSSID